jgi:hypothetical protein
MATDAEMVVALQTALATGAGIVSVTVDGLKTDFDRAQALQELALFERRAARAAGTRPTASSIVLGNL